MTWLLVLAWIIAYTICFAHIGLFFAAYLLTRTKSLMAYLLIICNLAFITAVVLLLILTQPEKWIFHSILVSCLCTYSITIPLFVRWYQGQALVRWQVLAGFALSMVLGNALVWLGWFGLAYSLFWVPSLLSAIPDKDKTSSLPKTIQPGPAGLLKLGRNTFLVAAVLAGVYLLIFLIGLPAWSGFTSLYFATFTLLYQIPGLVYVIGILKDHSLGRPIVLQPQSPMLILSPREKEVARKIVDGYSYDQIASQLFVSLSAIKKHIYNIYRKNGINNNRQLVRRMLDLENDSIHID